MLELRGRGNAEIQTDTTTLTPSREIVFASALYLILERGSRVSRSGLGELLWPDVELSTRGHRLRQTLLQLKKLGFPVVADKDRLSLSAGEVRIDVDRIPPETAVANQPSLEFLPGYSPQFSQPFRDWVDTKRGEVHSNLSRTLVTLLGRERARGNWPAVEEIARRVLQLDMFNESAVLALSEASAMRGQKREAVAMLDRYLNDVGSNNDIRLPANLLRKRILDTPPVGPQLLGDPLFVGRQAEIEVLTGGLKEARRGRGGAYLLLGDPGIGKSRLAAELAKFAGLQGVRTKTVGCQRSNVDRPLSVLVDLVPALREMPGAIGCSQETLLALRRLTEFDSRGVELSVSTAEAHAIQRALRHALFDLLDAITDEVSLVLIFDDIQWVDRTSADILAAMIAWSKTKRLLVVLTSRKDGTDSLELLTRTNIDLVELSGLTHASAETLLTSIVGDNRADPAPDMTHWMLDVGEGNPFFLQELAKHWLESGGSAVAPSSVSKVLRGRLSRLNPVSLRVLQACTVLGQNSTVERVEGVLEYTSHELLGAIQELSVAGMLSSSDDSTERVPLSLCTRHDLLSSAVLESMSSASRAFLHRRAGLVLEKELSGDRISTAVLWACSFHWHHAGDRDRALSVARSCAEHLLELGLPQDASEVLDRALDYCSTDEQRLSLLARQVNALQMGGQWARSKEVLLTCRQLRARSTPSGGQHDAFEIMLLDASARTSLNCLEILAEITPCVGSSEASPEHRVQAAVLALRLASDVDPFVMDSLYRTVEPLLTETVGNIVDRTEVEMVYHSIRGDGAKGMAAARALVESARQSKDPLRLAKALTNAGMSHRINGTLTDAQECFGEAFDCSFKHHLIDRATVALHCLARLSLSTGDIVLAREFLARSNALPTVPEDRHSITEQRVLEAHAALREGNIAQAASAWEIVREVSLAISPRRRASYLALEIKIRVSQGDGPVILRPLVSELETAHRKVWAMGLQDFEAEFLFLGLKTLGEERRGLGLITEYVSKHRRDRSPPGPYVNSILTERCQAMDALT
jgi:DNA-binding SARP family transcriptional activator